MVEKLNKEEIKNNEKKTTPISDKSEVNKIVSDELLVPLNMFLIDKSNIPTDKQHRLNTIEDCLKIFLSLKELCETFYTSSQYQDFINFIEDSNKKFKATSNELIKNAHLNNAQIFTLYHVREWASCLNELIIKPKMTYDDLKFVLTIQNPVEILPNLPQIPLKDLSEILVGINRIFPQYIPPEKSVIAKPSNQSFKVKNYELSPNSPQSNDILSSIIKPHLWTEETGSLQYVKEHKDRGYSQLSLFKTDSTGDFIPIDNYSVESILSAFDWKDRKILRLLMTEAIQHGGMFQVSGKWILKLIGDERSSVMTNGKRLSAKEKLADLEQRLLRYDQIRYQWSYKVGKKEFKALPDGFPLEAKLKIFNVNSTIIVKDGKGYDLIAEIIPGSWFEFNQNFLQEYTRIPEQLLKIDTTKNSRAYAIGERICVLFRINKEKFLRSGKNYQSGLTVKIKSLLDEILAPEEINNALINSCKGTRLKQGIIKDTEYLTKQLNWQFKWEGVSEGDNFNNFYNCASFTVILNDELEAGILGEKIIKPRKTKSSEITLTIDGELVKKLRKKLKLTQAEFAKVIKYSRPHISKIESGSEIPSKEFCNTLREKYYQEISKLQG